IRERGLTLLGVSLTALDDDSSVQLALEFERGSGPALDVTLDSVRSRFGARSVTRATLLGTRAPLEVPLLPDDPP
ncbi:MAG: DNA polymerase IV, partial [Pseudonocardia sp.]|nr:DNA polymerase IV [Pseudonocardia sp.]